MKKLTRQQMLIRAADLAAQMLNMDLTGEQIWLLYKRVANIYVILMDPFVKATGEQLFGFISRSQARAKRQAVDTDEAYPITFKNERCS